MKKSEKRLLIFLGLAVSYFVIDVFILKPDDSETAAKSKGNQDAQTTVLNESSAKISSRTTKMKAQNLVMASLDLSDLANWRKDPFLGSFTAELIDSLQGSIPYVLKAIAWRDETAHVIINNEVYKLGEEKDGFLVSEVRNDSVICYKNGQRFVLTFGE